MALGGALGVALTFGTVSLDELRSNGTFSAGYHHHVNSWLSVGGIVGYEGISLVFSSDESSGSDGDYSFIFAMPSATAKWFSRPSWSMYSRLSAGVITGIHEGQASWGFAFQASALLGLRFPGQRRRSGFRHREGEGFPRSRPWLPGHTSGRPAPVPLRLRPGRANKFVLHSASAYI